MNIKIYTITNPDEWKEVKSKKLTEIISKSLWMEIDKIKNNKEFKNEDFDIILLKEIEEILVSICITLNDQFQKDSLKFRLEFFYKFLESTNQLVVCFYNLELIELPTNNWEIIWNISSIPNGQEDILWKERLEKKLLEEILIDLNIK